MTAAEHYESDIREFLSREILFFSGDFPYTNETSLLDEGIIDSVGVLELVAFLECRFGVSVAPAEATRDNFDSVRKLADYVDRKRGEQCQVEQ
jgi:acyl carrier protein